MFNLTLTTIYQTWKHLLFYDHIRLTPEYVQQCADHVTAAGAFFENGRIFAFIDGTHERICLPGIDQEEFYSGQKKYHSIKFQAITTPDGIVIHLGGPFVGRLHDAGMATDSCIRAYLAHHALNPDGQQMIVYNDEGYGNSHQIKGPHRRLVTPLQNAENESMRRPRLCAEWTFDYNSNNWGTLNMYQKLRVRLSPIGLYFPVATIFTNLVVCMGRSNTTTSYYQMPPPTPERYLTPYAQWAPARHVLVVADLNDMV